MIDVGKNTYNKLIPQYTHEYLLSKRKIPTFKEPTIIPNITLTENFVQDIPDDATKKIIKHMNTYNQLQFCNTNKKIKTLCKNISPHLETLSYQLQYKTMAVGYQILIIKENKIYSMFLTDLVNMKSKFIKLKLPTIVCYI